MQKKNIEKWFEILTELTSSKKLLFEMNSDLNISKLTPIEINRGGIDGYVFEKINSFNENIIKNYQDIQTTYKETTNIPGEIKNILLKEVQTIKDTYHELNEKIWGEHYTTMEENGISSELIKPKLVIRLMEEYVKKK